MFDGNGNPTSYNGNSVSWDPEDRLTAYGSLLTAGYNGDDLRAWKQNASGRTYFLYDGSYPVIEMDGSEASPRSAPQGTELRCVSKLTDAGRHLATTGDVYSRG